ncbi:unnamed protein product [Auanema sp. JU1783]|nr:unnamed protein product [Auanema sp. JU1783]
MNGLTRYGYRLLRPRASVRRVSIKDACGPLLIGVFLGFLIGRIGFNSNLEDAANLHSSIDFHSPVTHNDTLFILRCVVMIHPKTKKASNFLTAIRDTYGKECNQTIYYTNDKKLSKQIADLNVIYLDTHSNAFYWEYFLMVMKLSADPPVPWTVFLDEQSYLVVENLRKTMQYFDYSKSVILSRAVQDNSIPTYIFPFLNRMRIPLQGGVVMSSSAITALHTCHDGLWPTFTETSLYSCIFDRNLTIVDPIDEEGMHLFNYLNFKTVVSKSYQEKEKGNKMGYDCCSDHAVTFGQLTYKEIRMAHYTSSSLRVFGRTEELEYVDDDYFIKNETTTTTTKKPAQKKKVQTVKKVPEKKQAETGDKS